jgi:hypothetical protein
MTRLFGESMIFSKLMKSSPLGYRELTLIEHREIRSVVIQHRQLKFVYADLGEIQQWRTEAANMIGRTMEGF